MAEPTKRKREVERIEDWDDARYAHVPPRAATDERLTLVHLRMLILIGKVNTKQGWCQLSQKAAADLFGMHRKTVNAAVADLVAWGYVDRRTQTETKTSFCHYRVLIDEPEFAEGVPPQDGTPPGGGVPPYEGTGVTPGSYTGVPPETAPPIYKARAREIRDQRSLSPLSPQGGAWASGWTLASQRLVDEMRSSPLEGRIAVAEHFVDAVRATLTPPRSVDAEAYTRQLANRLSVFAADVLAATAQQMINTRGTSLPAAIDIEKVAKTIAARTVAKPAAAAAGVAAVACNPALADRWDVMRDELRSQLGDDVFAAWYGGLAAVRLERGMLELGAPASFTASWLRQHHGPAMLAAARAAFGPEIEHVTVISQQGKAA